MSDAPSVTSAIAAVMAEVTSVSKGDRMDAPGAKFAYRGVDRVVKALSASMRKNGLVMAPVASDVPEYIPVTTSNGKPASMARVLVTYRVYGPAGDYIECAAPGEAMDNGDKAVSKAMSVAWRTALLQLFFLPTEEPDPDSEAYELGQGQQVRGGNSPAVQQRLQERDDREDALRQEWKEAVERAQGDKEALTRLWKQATAQRLPREVVAMIEAAGNATA